MSWHVDEATAGRYAMAATDPATAASIDAHVIACADCQAVVGRAADADLLASIWKGIDDTLDQPQIGWIERLLRAGGCSDTVSRIIAASTRAHFSFVLVVVFSIALAVWSSVSNEDVDIAFGGFLLVAPLGPLVATASAFSRWTDPTYALTNTLPVSTWRMILVRTIAAVLPAVALTALSTPWLLDRGWLAVAWLLPSLALASAVLALSSVIDIELATLAVTVAWLALPIGLRFGGGNVIDAFSGPLQPTSVAAIACGVAVTLTRRTHFEYRRF